MLLRTVVESPTLEVFKKHLDLNLGDVVWWFRGYSDGAGLMILKVTSSRDGSMIVWFYEGVEQKQTEIKAAFLPPVYSFPFCY